MGNDERALSAHSIYVSGAQKTTLTRQEVLLSYASAGWQLVRIKPGQKLPLDKEWQTLSPQPENFSVDQNVGVQLGPKSGGLIDIDLDIPQARALAGLPCFFGGLPSFGRSTLPMDQLGHRVCICKDAPDKKFAFAFTTKEAKEATASLKLEKGVVLEVRAGGGHQTVFPPSSYPGCELVWKPGFRGSIPTMDWESVRTLSGILAFCSFAAACYPAEGGRDDFCLSFAGALLHIGVPEDDAEDMPTGCTSYEMKPAGYEIIEKMAANGRAVHSIAKALGIDAATFSRLRKRDPLAEEALERGKAGLGDELSDILLTHARSGNVVAAIFLAKARLGWRDQGPTDNAQTVNTQVNITIPPATTQEEFQRFIGGTLPGTPGGDGE